MFQGQQQQDWAAVDCRKQKSKRKLIECAGNGTEVLGYVLLRDNITRLVSLEISMNLSEMPVRELGKPACSPGTVEGDVQLKGP